MLSILSVLPNRPAPLSLLPLLTSFPQDTLLRHRLVVFVVSTTGQGDMPHNALLFWRRLLRRKLPPRCLARLRYACLGLGDSTYIKCASSLGPVLPLRPLPRPM